jgi:hypothetical protein
MKKFIFKVALWIGILFLFFLLILHPLDPPITANKKRVYLEEYSVKNVDLLILGSSRAEHSIKPTLFADSLTVFNAGEDGYGLPSNYFLLKALLEKHQVKIKKILFQIDETAMNGDVGFSRKFRDDAFIEDIKDDEVYEAYKTYRNPYVAYAVRQYPQLGNLIYTNFKNFISHYPVVLKNHSETIKELYNKDIQKLHTTKGYAAIYESKVNEKEKSGRTYIIQNDDLHYFNKLIALCKQHNIELTMFRAPILYCNENDATLFDNFIDSFSKKNQIRFLDYKCEYQNPNLYLDKTHIVDSAATLLTQNIIKKIYHQ